MLTTEEMLETLACLMLEYGYEQVQYLQYDIICPEVDNNMATYKKAVRYHWVLNSGCDVDSELLCQIESFVKKNPCVCPTCIATCTSFTLEDTAEVTACDGYSITLVVDDP